MIKGEKNGTNNGKVYCMNKFGSGRVLFSNLKYRCSRSVNLRKWVNELLLKSAILLLPFDCMMLFYKPSSLYIYLQPILLNSAFCPS